MAYEIGSYLKGLKAEHQNGEHVESENFDCPACNYEVVPAGFTSLKEYDEAVLKGALELEADAIAHEAGRHKDKSVAACIECVVREEE